MKQLKECSFPLVLSVLKWSCEEKLGSVRPSGKFCTSVTVYNRVTWGKAPPPPPGAERPPPYLTTNLRMPVGPSHD